MAHNLRDRAGQILRMLAVDRAGKASTRVFVLGGHQEPRVNLSAQQNRAPNLIWALRERGRLARDGDPTRVVVIGAGVAGATAAAAVAREGAEVVLIDVHEEPITVQRAATARYLHPTLFDWPLADHYPPVAELPLLNWTAQTADNVRNQLVAGFVAAVRDRTPAFTWLPQTFVTAVNEPVDPDEDVLIEYLRLFNLCDTASDADEQPSFDYAVADIVILACGFLPERQVRDTVSGTYWKDDRLHELGENILIVGDGDGALTELFRLGLKGAQNDIHWTQQQLSALVHSPSDALRAKVRDLENDMRNDINAGSLSVLSVDDHPLKDLDQQIKMRRRRTLRVVGRGPLLRRNSFVLNRFLAARMHGNGAAEIMKASLQEADVYELSAKWEIVWRTGPPRRDPDLRSPFFDVDGLVKAIGSNAAQAKTAGLTSDVLDETRTPYFDGTDHPLGACRSVPQRKPLLQSLDELAERSRWHRLQPPSSGAGLPNAFLPNTKAAIQGPMPKSPWPDHHQRIIHTALVLASIARSDIHAVDYLWWYDFPNYYPCISLDFLALACDLTPEHIALTIALGGPGPLRLAFGTPRIPGSRHQLEQRVWVSILQRIELNDADPAALADLLAVMRAPRTWNSVDILRQPSTTEAAVYQATPAYETASANTFSFLGRLARQLRPHAATYEGLTRGARPHQQLALFTLSEALDAYQTADQPDNERREIAEAAVDVFARSIASQEASLVRPALIIFGRIVRELADADPLLAWTRETVIPDRDDVSPADLGEALMRTAAAPLRPLVQDPLSAEPSVELADLSATHLSFAMRGAADRADESPFVSHARRLLEQSPDGAVPSEELARLRRGGFLVDLEFAGLTAGRRRQGQRSPRQDSDARR